MKLEIEKSVGRVTAEKGAVKSWKSNPANWTAAAVAALHYAKKFDEPMVVVKGNSYGHVVLSIVRQTEDLKKFTVMAVKASVLVVHPDGSVFQAIAG